MGNVILLEETTKNPLSLMGMRAGVCWGSDITDPEKNRKRGISCMKSGHGRVEEFVNIEMILDGYSARVIREWYTHVGGAPTRLQESTRYVDYNEQFPYVIPNSIAGKDENSIYITAMGEIQRVYSELVGMGIPKEDAAMILPLGMRTKMVDKRNLRNLIEMSHQRMCTRAYHEYRDLMNDIYSALYDYSDEWKYICSEYLKPKCEVSGYCEEAHSCGRKPKKA